MKRLVSVSLCVLIIVFSFDVYAQTISWEIKLHNSTNTNILTEEITAYVNNGYVPLGITYDNTELYILYVQDDEFGMQAWSLDWYEDRNELQNSITNQMNQGYIPTGITYTGDLFYVLYIQVESSAEAWRLEPAPSTNLKAVQKTIQPYIKQGYLPVGITELENKYWTLLLRIPDTTAQYWSIETYDVGRHANPINSKIEQGYVPWGVMYNRNAGEIDILYVKF